jgi:hypothetical protein
VSFETGSISLSGVSSICKGCSTVTKNDSRTDNISILPLDRNCNLKRTVGEKGCGLRMRQGEKELEV